MDDWRLKNQERYLKGATLIRKPYTDFSDNWEHDHCAFCSAKISTYPGTLSEGYATVKDGIVGYHWICDECFKDFKDRFQWVVLLPGTDLPIGQPAPSGSRLTRFLARIFLPNRARKVLASQPQHDSLP